MLGGSGSSPESYSENIGISINISIYREKRQHWLPVPILNFAWEQGNTQGIGTLWQKHSGALGSWGKTLPCAKGPEEFQGDRQGKYTVLQEPGMGYWCPTPQAVWFSELHLIFGSPGAQPVRKGRTMEITHELALIWWSQLPHLVARARGKGGGSALAAWVQSFLPACLPSSFLVSTAIDIKIKGLA